MIKKFVLVATVAAVATAFAPTASFAMRHHMVKPCTPGSLTTYKPDKMGWGQVEICGMDGKWYPEPMMCYVPSGLCPK